MDTKQHIEKTEALIDALRATCSAYGLSGDSSEYKIIVQVFLYKYLNDKFGYEVKRADTDYRDRLRNAEHWEDAYKELTDDEREDLQDFVPEAPRMKPEFLIASLYNRMAEDGFASTFDDTMVALGQANADRYSIKTSGKSNVALFEAITTNVTDVDKRDDFAKALVNKLITFNFEEVFDQKYDFFATVFEYLIADYNKNGGGKYAEYFTPHAVATVMARLLVDEKEELKSITCCDPSAGTGTLLMALAHQIGEDRCTIYSQDQSQKSTTMLRLNLILNNLVHSLPNVVQGDSLISWGHAGKNGEMMEQFDYVVSNPPFNVDFSESVTHKAFQNTDRFFAGVPNIPNKKKDSMAIYQCFLQHILYILKPTGKAAVVVPTGFLTASSGIPLKIKQRIIDEGWLRGVVSMPSNIFANTGTNVSVIFIDKSNTDGEIILIDASKLGEKVKIDNNQKTVLRNFEIEQIIDTFKRQKEVDDFSKVVTFDDIKQKKYSLSAGQYFDIKIEYVDITAEEFNSRMAEHKKKLSEMFSESHELEKEIMKQLERLKFNDK
ncbi:MAG: type I restriction-modification system subunit M [Bacteroidales bacterium]|nr:type I restriction-modification system subunit M [Bacteroidales bacterium]